MLLSTTYAIQGLIYFLAHPQLWWLALCPFILVIVCSIGTTLITLISIYPLLALALQNYARWHPALAWIIAFLIALILAALISLILFAALPPAYLDLVFRKTLLIRGCPSADLIRLQDSGHPIGLGCARNCSACLKVSVWIRISIAILTFPLHAIPILGTLAWIWMNGIVLLWELHASWFDLHHAGYTNQKTFILSNWSSYWAAGMLAQTLEMIPLLNWLFCWSNAVGAALMVADMEEAGKLPIPVSVSESLDRLVNQPPSLIQRSSE